jgi:RimJ/RimL family protein N-acetyltransferase
MPETQKTDMTQQPNTETVPHPLTLYTDGGLVLRQYATPEDDVTYLKIQNENREHIAEFGNKIYETSQEVREARLNSKGILRMGIWKDDELIGEVCVASKDGEEAEMGIWIAKHETGHGYATSVLQTATSYAVSKFRRVFAEVDPKNSISINLLKRAGYSDTGKTVERNWANEPALIFEPAQNPAL